MSKARAHVLISGHVQGVFFRAYTQQAALERGVHGWVRNTRDRRVEAVLEGEKEQVQDMIRWCHRGSPMSQVTAVDVDWQEYSGEFNDFSVKYSF
ncbi:MAG: acylphosphatase [Syntrophobacteria bacterium]